MGIGILTLGADLLVRGAAALALRLGLSPLLIGLTVVAFGTSMPEVAVSVGSAIIGDGSVALGNVLGSNIFNILVVLGGAAVIRPLVVHRHLVRLDVPVMIGTAALVLLLSLNGRITRFEGAFLLALGILYTFLLVRAGLEAEGNGGGPSLDESRAVEGMTARSSHRVQGDGQAPPAPYLPLQLLWIGLGLVLLVTGAHFLVRGAEALARAVGVSELIIGLTVVAAGTSLPELATSFVAAVRGQRDIAVGNVVGSNIFNALVVLGVASIAAGPAGIGVPEGVLTFDFPLMLAVSVACLPIFFTGWSISRWEGWVFLGYYGAYLLYLVLSHTEHAGEDLIRAVLIFFAAPLTLLTLVVLVMRQLRAASSRPGDPPRAEGGPDPGP
jgi:cation:H+ antiporter